MTEENNKIVGKDNFKDKINLSDKCFFSHALLDEDIVIALKFMEKHKIEMTNCGEANMMTHEILAEAPEPFFHVVLAHSLTKHKWQEHPPKLFWDYLPQSILSSTGFYNVTFRDSERSRSQRVARALEGKGTQDDESAKQEWGTKSKSSAGHRVPMTVKTPNAGLQMQAPDSSESPTDVWGILMNLIDLQSRYCNTNDFSEMDAMLNGALKRLVAVAIMHGSATLNIILDILASKVTAIGDNSNTKMQNFTAVLMKLQYMYTAVNQKIHGT